jgi:hypothetical protein
MSDKYDLAYLSTSELASAGANYTSHKCLVIDSTGRPVTDTTANFISKMGIVPTSSLSSYVTTTALNTELSDYTTTANLSAVVEPLVDDYLDETHIRHVTLTVLTADLNAGKVILAGVAGKKIRVVDFVAKVDGTFDTVTSYILEDTDATPVVIQTMAVAALTDGAILKDGTADVTRDVGMYGYLTDEEGIQVVKDGTDGATGTSITFDISYTLTDI